MSEQGPRMESSESTRRERAVAPWLAPLIAGIVVITLLGAARLNRGPDWRSGSSDGGALPPPGQPLIHNGAGPLRLVCPGFARLELAPGTEMTVPTTPNRWIGRAIGMHLTKGELRVSTDPTLVNRLFVINAPAADLVPISPGSIFLVQAGAESTAVAVLAAGVHLLPLKGQAVVVHAGERRAAGGAGLGLTRALDDEERRALEAMRSAR